MVKKNSTTNLTELLLECVSQPDPMLSMLEWLCNQLMEDEEIARSNYRDTIAQVPHPEYTELVCTEMDAILRDKSYKAPWFGQLMTGPQMMAYLIQINIWLKEYKVKLEI